MIKRLYDILPDYTGREYKRGQLLIYEGDLVNRFFYIKTGYVKVYTISKVGENRTLVILKPGDLFPLLKDPDQSAQSSLYFYAALSDVKLHVFPQASLLATIRKNHQAAWVMLRYISEFSGLLANRLSVIENSNAEDKVEILLGYLVQVCGIKLKPDIYKLALKFTYQDIADMIGHVRETASAQMKKLETRGVVTSQDGFIVVNLNPASKSGSSRGRAQSVDNAQ